MFLVTKKCKNLKGLVETLMVNMLVLHPYVMAGSLNLVYFFSDEKVYANLD